MHKHCPFCGGTRVSIEEGLTFRWRHARCDECGARACGVRIQTTGEFLHNCDAEYAAEVAAMKRWDERSETKVDAAAAKVLQASHHGDQHFITALNRTECTQLCVALLDLAAAFREEIDDE